MAETAPPVNIVSTEQLALLFACTPQHVNRLAAQGIITKTGRSEFPLFKSVTAYVTHLRDEASKQTRSAAASRASDARAREIELRIQKQMNSLVSVDEIDAIIDHGFGALKSRLIGIPAQGTKDPRLRRTFEDLINGALADTASFLLESAASLRAHGEVVETVSEDDA